MHTQSVSEIMLSFEFCQIDAQASLSCALNLMRELRVNALLVHEAGEFCGLLTRRNIIRPVSDGRAHVSVTRVFEVMDRDPAILRAGSRILPAVVQMKQSGLRQVVIVDDQVNAVGILDWRDIPVDQREAAQDEFDRHMAMAAE